MENKILVLGASGFIGKYLCENLKAIPITRNECNLENYIEVQRLLEKHCPDIVLNCAVAYDVSMEYFKPEYYYRNIVMYDNLVANNSLYGKLISFGSGAEFDRRYSIDLCKEEDIFKRNPNDHYGESKNYISRLSKNIENSYILRIFGLFHNTEPNSRLLKKLFTSSQINVENRFFDYFYLKDVLKVVEYYIKETPLYKDINLVYMEKILLSEIIDIFINAHNLKPKIKYKESKLNYTGSGYKLNELNLNLIGIDEGLKEY